MSETITTVVLLVIRSWLGVDIVAIATTDVGDPIYLRPGRTESDRVCLTHHDGGDTEVFAASPAEMLDKLRQARVRSGGSV